MADVGASKEMLLHQLNALMADAAGDAETMELYQAKLAELDAARRANADLEQQLQASNQAKENLQRQLASVAQDAKTATDALHDQLQTALADKVDLERHLESVQRELGDVQEAKNSALGDLDRSNQEVDSLREELRDMRRRVQAAEDAGSEAQKVLHVMSAEAEASRREQDNLRERVAGVAETLAAVRVAERAAADARTALDSEVAALAHAAVRRGAPPLAVPKVAGPGAQVPPAPALPPMPAAQRREPKKRTTPPAGKTRNPYAASNRG
jgi:chromosome segregation ATPase